jgi:asparagine synthase (glutamine-hydrolysing)
MCGITGIFSQSRISRDHIISMNTSLCHRGPDAEDVYINQPGDVALGHTRLSIIDLSSIANQPMHSADGNFVIVFNGEIYNHLTLRKELTDNDPSLKLKTKSDTEIILEGFIRWGTAVVAKLEGMFAFAIHDRQRDQLFLSRDRVGKKPLFYYQDDSHFIFASEIKALLKHPAVKANREINKEALYTFLHLGYIPEPDSIFTSIKKFKAGHWGFVKSNTLETTPYWKPVDFTNKKKTWSPDDAVKSLRTALYDAVEKRLISDVPLGAFLSGGTDSSLVVAMASKVKADKLKTFTIGFKESKFNESLYAKKVAQHLGTDHHEYILHESEAIGILETYLKHFDEPFADTSAVPTLLVSKLARKEVTVALTGDGGDELFLGYGSYDWANRLGEPGWKVMQSPLSFFMKTFGNDRFKRISFLLQKVDDDKKRSHIFSQEQYFFTQQEISQLLSDQDKHHQIFSYKDPNPELTEAEKQALFDIQYYLKDDLLVKVDRASMYSGLECRCPLLDHHVIELALGLPPSLKRSKSHRKWILKELLREHLPNELVDRPKWGFGIPLGRWMRNDLRYLIDRYLNEDLITSTGIVNNHYVQKLKTSFLQGENYLYNRLWVLIVLHKWLYENSSSE